MTDDRPSTGKLILVPALFTLIVTLVRLYGELHHWAKPWFSAEAGGGGAIIGISWLPVFFGPYFAVKLGRSGAGPTSTGKSFLFTVIGLIVVIGGGYVGFAGGPGGVSVRNLLGYAIMLVGALITIGGWPALIKTLFAYGYAARIPVAIIMYFAMTGGWGTHYDALPPGYPPDVSFWAKYIGIGLLPQLVFWIVYTVVVGSIFGDIVGAIAGRGKAAAQAA